MDISSKDIADPKYSKVNPHPNWTNAMRQINWSKGQKEYKENYDKIVWNKDKLKDDKCTHTTSEKNITD